jgi:hypothetical protein
MQSSFLERRLGEVRTIRQPRDKAHKQNLTRFGILNYTNTSHTRRHTLHVARRFELFLDAYRRPDGGRWTGQKLDEATGGVVPRSYVTNLRKGRSAWQLLEMICLS